MRPRNGVQRPVEDVALGDINNGYFLGGLSPQEFEVLHKRLGRASRDEVKGFTDMSESELNNAWRSLANKAERYYGRGNRL